MTEEQTIPAPIPTPNPAQPEERTFVCGPYIGEFGWEVFSWVPLTHALATRKKYGHVIVYTAQGAGGKALLYPFADEVRPCDGLPDYEPECLGWREFRSHVDELNAWTKENVVDAAREETNDNADIFTLARLPALNDPHYGMGKPVLLRRRVGEGGGVPEVVLCVRDRPLSDFRNWDQEDWCELAKILLAGTPKRRVAFVGQTRDDWTNVLPSGVDNQLNQTTIDHLIAWFSRDNVLAVGGSTGTLHLASACGTPHLVWGGEKNVLRYAETNWFAAPHQVYEWGWDPDPATVAVAVDHYLQTGRFL